MVSRTARCHTVIVSLGESRFSNSWWYVGAEIRWKNYFSGECFFICCRCCSHSSISHVRLVKILLRMKLIDFFTRIYEIISDINHHIGDAGGLIFSQVLIGFLQGPLIPAISSFSAGWFPIEERGRMISIIFMGVNVRTPQWCFEDLVKKNISRIHLVSDIWHIFCVSCGIDHRRKWPMGYRILWICCDNCIMWHFICMWILASSILNDYRISFEMYFTEILFLDDFLLRKSTKSSIYQQCRKGIFENEHCQLFRSWTKKCTTNTVEGNFYQRSSISTICNLSK